MLGTIFLGKQSRHSLNITNKNVCLLLSFIDNTGIKMINKICVVKIDFINCLNMLCRKR